MAGVVKTPSATEAKLAADYSGVRAALPGTSSVGQLRDAAFDQFVSLGLPSRRVEAWHYTDLRIAMREALPLAKATRAGVAVNTLAPAIADVESIRLVLVDGFFAPDVSDVARLPKGVSVSSLADGLTKGDAGLMEALSASALGQGDAALALNTAFMQGGVIIDVAAGVQVSSAIEIVSLTSDDASQAVYARSLLRVGQGAKVTVVEREAGGASHAQQRNNAFVVMVADEAQVEHVFVPALWHAGSTHVASLLVSLGAKSQFNSFTLTRGGGLLRRQVFMRFDGEHAKGQLAGASLLQGKDHADTTLVVQHVAAHCESREYFKTMLDGEATGVYQGKVMVAPGAQKTDGAMKSHAILLSDNATMNNKPELEIFADDVVCGHGATVAQLDEDQIFYAMARGLPKPVAESMLLEAFVDEATDRVENETLQAYLKGLIAQWLAARGRA